MTSRSNLKTPRSRSRANDPFPCEFAPTSKYVRRFRDMQKTWSVYSGIRFGRVSGDGRLYAGRVGETSILAPTRVTPMNHNRTYTAALAILAAIATVSSGLLLFLASTAASGSVETTIPAWALPWVAGINFAYVVAITVTLCVRSLKPSTGRKITRILNWALLPALPGGTVVGLYGLMIADKGSAKP